MRSYLRCVIAFLIVASSAASQAADKPAADYAITKIRVYPRGGHAAEMQGGKFVGSLTSATNDFEDIADLKEAPAEGQWTEIAVSRNRIRAFRFVKYHARNDVWADMAELEFYAGDRKLTGTPFGTTGSRETSNDPKLAFDGDTKTFFRGTSGFNQYIGLDLGADSQAIAPALSVAQGTYAQAQAVSLSAAAPDAKILYSLDGWGWPGLNERGQPERGAKWYDGTPIRVEKSMILQAVSVKAGLADSPLAIAAYRIGEVKPDPAEHAQFHIGNSLTDTVNGWMEPLAASGGHKIRYSRFTIPGAPTDWLWDHSGSGFGESNYA